MKVLTICMVWLCSLYCTSFVEEVTIPNETRAVFINKAEGGERFELVVNEGNFALYRERTLGRLFFVVHQLEGELDDSLYNPHCLHAPLLQKVQVEDDPNVRHWLICLAKRTHRIDDDYDVCSLYIPLIFHRPTDKFYQLKSIFDRSHGLTDVSYE